MHDSVYCYPETDILINKLNIHDDSILQEAERELTSRRLVQLADHPINGRFDYSHLKRIHRFIFQDVYAWAGQERTVDIAKTNMFCNVKFIDTQAEEIFGRLKQEKLLKGLEREAFIERVSYFWGEINALHPFREGNGRTQREFIRELAIRAGYDIDYATISEQEMILASIDSFACNYDRLRELFEKAVKRY